MIPERRTRLSTTPGPTGCLQGSDSSGAKPTIFEVVASGKASATSRTRRPEMRIENTILAENLASGRVRWLFLRCYRNPLSLSHLGHPRTYHERKPNPDTVSHVIISDRGAYVVNWQGGHRYADPGCLAAIGYDTAIPTAFENHEFSGRVGEGRASARPSVFRR